MRTLQRFYDRRTNALGRWAVDLHRRYYRPRWVPVLWMVLIVSWALQIMLVAFAR